MGRGADGNSLYFLLHFSGSLKLLGGKKSLLIEKKIKKKDKEGKKGRKKSRGKRLGGGYEGDKW